MGAQDAAGHAGNYESPGQTLIYMAMGNVADTGGCGREPFGRMDARRSCRRGDSHAYQQRVRNNAERHAERSVHQLRRKAGGDEWQQCLKWESDRVHAAIPSSRSNPPQFLIQATGTTSVRVLASVHHAAVSASLAHELKEEGEHVDEVEIDRQRTPSARLDGVGPQPSMTDMLTCQFMTVR